MTIDVTAVNDVPVASNNTVSTNEDTPLNFASGDFTFTRRRRRCPGQCSAHEPQPQWRHADALRRHGGQQRRHAHRRPARHPGLHPADQPKRLGLCLLRLPRQRQRRGHRRRHHDHRRHRRQRRARGQQQHGQHQRRHAAQLRLERFYLHGRRRRRPGQCSDHEPQSEWRHLDAFRRHGGQQRRYAHRRPARHPGLHAADEPKRFGLCLLRLPRQRQRCGHRGGHHDHRRHRRQRRARGQQQHGQHQRRHAAQLRLGRFYLHATSKAMPWSVPSSPTSTSTAAR